MGPAILARMEQGDSFTSDRIFSLHTGEFPVVTALAGQGQIGKAMVSTPSDWDDVLERKWVRGVLGKAPAIFTAATSALRDCFLVTRRRTVSTHRGRT